MAKNQTTNPSDVDVTRASDVPVYCAHTEIVAAAKLVQNPRNPNTHPPRQIDVLARIIVAQGWRAPITVSRRSGFIVRGHGRLKAAIKAGLEEVPVDYQDYEDEAAEWADLVADNRIAELAEIDMDILRDNLKELDFSSFDMTLTGYDIGDLAKILEEKFEIGNNADAEWEDMPDYVSEDVLAFRRVIVNFGSAEAVEEFQRRLEVTMTDKTRFIHYPPVPEDTESGQKRWVAGTEEAKAQAAEVQ